MLERTSEWPVGPGPRCVKRLEPTRMRGETEYVRGESKGTGPGRRCRPCEISGLAAAPAGRIGSDGDATASSEARPNTLCRVQARIGRGSADAKTTDHVDPNCRVFVPGWVQRPSGRSEVCDERYEDSSLQLSRPSGCFGVTTLCLTLRLTGERAQPASPVQPRVRLLSWLGPPAQPTASLSLRPRQDEADMVVRRCAHQDVLMPWPFDRCSKQQWPAK